MGMSGVSAVDELYRLYPKHVSPRTAKRAIANALKRLDLELKLAGKDIQDSVAWLKECVGAFAGSPAGQVDGLFKGYKPPYPASWFNGSRYLDDKDTWYEVSMTREEEQEMRMAAAANVGVWRPS
jgi:hypothetical protein